VPEPILVVQGVTAGYGGVPVINGVSIQATSGQITVIVGLNGSGKSTLLKAITGVVKPVSGTVMLDGNDVTGLKPQRLIRRGLSYVPQVANVFPSLTVIENLEMGGFILRSGGLRHLSGSSGRTTPPGEDFEWRPKTYAGARPWHDGRSYGPTT
jgi:ABC-type branched-subunit amino acid transport system ATPase component